MDISNQNLMLAFGLTLLAGLSTGSEVLLLFIQSRQIQDFFRLLWGFPPV